MEERRPHFLLVTFPVQGQINPGLEFSKRLLRAGAYVTFVTSVSAHCRFDKAAIPKGLTLAAFSDGYDNGFKPTDGDVQTYLLKFRQSGAHTLAELLQKSAAEGNGVTCLVYTLLLSWAAEVAREFHVPSAVLWIQPAAVFDIYYYYFNGYKSVIDECEKDPSWSLELPGLPFTLKAHDLPSFLLPSNPDPYTFATFQEQIEVLKKMENPKILVNTFEALELDALRSIDVERPNLIPIGPLLPSAFLDERDPAEKSSGGDLFRLKEGDYFKWLSSQETSSVIYVSFGSISVLSKSQMEELGRALVQTHRPFLWVIREDNEQHEQKENDEKVSEETDKLSCMEELKEQGLIVPWCSQVEVLSHPSIGCFVTHCGWNSTLESLTSGVPLVAFPQWTDQTTNAKLVEDVWKTGVRVKASDEEEGLVKSEEIKRCLEVVLGSEEMRENAKRWRELAVESAKEGGSSHTNLNAFIKEVLDHHHNGN